MKKLCDISKGKFVEIIDFVDNITKCASARFGLATGQVVLCKAKVGPVVISKNQQIIAIGRNMSEKILVREI